MSLNPNELRAVVAIIQAVVTRTGEEREGSWTNKRGISGIFSSFSCILFLHFSYLNPFLMLHACILARCLSPWTLSAPLCFYDSFEYDFN